MSVEDQISEYIAEIVAAVGPEGLPDYADRAPAIQIAKLQDVWRRL